jgi:hypothetical protein
MRWPGFEVNVYVYLKTHEPIRKRMASSKHTLSCRKNSTLCLLVSKSVRILQSHLLFHPGWYTLTQSFSSQLCARDQSSSFSFRLRAFYVHAATPCEFEHYDKYKHKCTSRLSFNCIHRLLIFMPTLCLPAIPSHPFPQSFVHEKFGRQFMHGADFSVLQTRFMSALVKIKSFTFQ